MSPLDSVYTRTGMDTSPQAGATSTLAPPRLVDQPLKVVSRRDPLLVSPGTPLSACLDAIRNSGMADSVFVTDSDGRLLGVLAERDVFARLVVGRGQSAVDLAAPVETLMNRAPHTLQLEQPVRSALELMETGTYRNIPLVDGEGRLEGVVRPLDMLRYLAESFPEELLNLPPRPQQLMDAAEGA
jgi:CBS domain-containing protein